MVKSGDDGHHGRINRFKLKATGPEEIMLCPGLFYLNFEAFLFTSAKKLESKARSLNEARSVFLIRPSVIFER